MVWNLIGIVLGLIVLFVVLSMIGIFWTFLRIGWAIFGTLFMIFVCVMLFCSLVF